MRRMILVAAALGLVAADAPDAGTGGAGGGAATPWVDTQNNEVVVWGDLFARWDETRWFIATEIETPFPVLFAKEKNAQFLTAGYQIRTVIACSKTWKLNKNRFEVDCKIEDVGLQAALADNYNAEWIATGNAVLAELDAKLTGAGVQLQVAEDGRVVSIDLEGVSEDNDREQEIHETLRQVMSRVAVGFDMKMQKFNQLNEGKWIEYHSALMSMPLPANATATRASSTLIHYLNRYRGNILVQSIGRGMIELPAMNGPRNSGPDLSAATSNSGAPSRGGGGLSASSGSRASFGEENTSQWTLPDLTFETDLIGVSIYDPDDGFMTERVWALEGKPTATAGLRTRGYWHAGRIMMLGETDHPDVGPSRIVGPRNSAAPGAPDWESIDQGMK